MGNKLLKFLLISLFMGYLSSLGFSQCTYSVKLFNQNGTGWDADRLTVYVNGTPVLANIFLSSGYGPVDYSFPVGDGQTISFDYADNTYPSVPANINPGNYFQLYDHQGNMLQAYGAPPSPALSIAGGGIMNLSPVVTASCATIDLAVTGISQNFPLTPHVVTVGLKNNGSVNASGFNVSLAVVGNPVQTSPFVGTLLPGQTASVNFTVPSIGANIINASASHDLAGDLVTSNNSVSGSVVNKLCDLEVVSVACTPGSAASTITLNVKNNGPVTLNGVADLFPIGYTVNSGAPVVQNYVPAAFTSGSTISIPFGTTADLSAGGNYTVLGYATFYGDLTLSNNSATNTFFIGGDLAVSWATIGGGCGLTVPRVLVTNVGTNPFDIQAGTKVYYSINGGLPVEYTFGSPVVLSPASSQLIAFPGADLSAATTFAAGFQSPFTDNNNANNTITGNFSGSVTALPVITPASPFLYPSFAATQYFSYMSLSNSNVSVAGGSLVMAGMDSPSLPWVGGFGIDGTSEYDAWTSNASHISAAVLCGVNTNSFSPNAELLLDIQQEYAVGPGYTYFRVLMDGVALADAITGKSVFTPSDFDSPSTWQTLRFNLPNTSSFVITLQASNNFAGNLTRIKNVKIRQKPSVDVGVAAILSPASGCGLSSTPVVTVKIKNYGVNNASGIQVSVNINGLGTVSTVYVPTLPPNGTANVNLTPGYAVTYPATVVASVTKTGDVDLDNNTMSVTVKDYLSTIPYSSNFSSDPYAEGWSNLDNNGGNQWSWILQGLGDPAVGFNFYNQAGNDWIFSKCLKVNSANDTVLVDFAYSTLNSATGHQLTFAYGTTPTEAGMTNILGNWSNVNTAGSYAGFVLTGLLPSNTYYFGWKASGPAANAASYLVIDDFETALVGKTDLQVTQVISGTSACTGSSGQTVQIQLTNNGPFGLNAGTVIPVTYSINSGTPVSENFVLPAALASGSSQMFSFATLANFSTPGAYVVTGDVNFSYERTPANDALSQNFTIYGYPSGLYFDQNGMSLCYGVSASLGLTGGSVEHIWAGPYSGVFSGADVTEDLINNSATFVFPSLAPGSSASYTVTFAVTNGGGCESTLSGTLLVSNPSVSLPADFATPDYSSVVLDAGVGSGPVPYSYAWSTGQNTQTIVPPYYGYYSVTVTQGPASCQASSDVVLYQIQEIPLNPGWGLFSTLINTAIAPDTYTSISEYFAGPLNPGLDSKVVIVKNYSGTGVFWPLPFPLPTINNIGDFVIGEGYQYKMQNLPNLVLHVAGVPVVPEVTPVNLYVGYSFIGYLRQSPGAISTMLDAVDGNAGFLVKDELGKLYWPAYSINTIHNMVKGKGYKVRSLVNTSFTYPANSVAVPIANDKSESLDPQHYQVENRSGNNMALAIPIEAWSNIPVQGSEIGVFDASGNLCGSGSFAGQNVAFVVWGDDETTSAKDGLVEGESLTIRIWNPANGEENSYEVTSWREGNGLYGTDAVSVIGSLKASNAGQMGASVELFQNFPNPVSGSSDIKFYISEGSQVELTIINVLGEVVKTVVDQQLSEGMHSYSVDCTDLSSGAYYFRLSNGQSVTARKFAVQK